MGSQRALFMMAPTRDAALLLPRAAFLCILILATTARAQPRQARMQDVEGETTATMSQVSTSKEPMVDNDMEAEEANKVMDPMDQCDKCRKAAYTYKKKFFCQKCVKEGHLKEADTVVNCSKCRKPRYRARNGDFCGQECPNTSAGGMMVDKATINDIDNGDVEPTVVTTLVDTKTPELGVLGSIFKFLVQANTWGEVPAHIPQATSPVAGETEEEM